MWVFRTECSANVMSARDAGKLARRRRGDLVALALAGVCACIETDAFAQAETDRFNYEEADIHAACNSKDLPGRGFAIIQIVPNTKGKDCYWKRVASPPPVSDVRSAIEAARARRDAAMREVDAMRAGGWPAFWRHFNACGGDATCQSGSSSSS